ncbi:MAG: hypothetical protein A2015_00785 [Spirochaetes bacterium GWF1_31_7]|nr:MAG: hypothetical protein A2Y30_12650 [Spirochaetes bacterium GWE1_32_154]OHD51658.1 MAG: hypothetical protein A2Y29_04450 [Spirochaetes bacterium GWE2_31_10]OHD51911.1 MAG: hypothetical protein A2015_00785 [Spirochaetes bacterium GWF1_31_7]HBD93787.1 hypothetical protein [Spirochaetia bacterium]
MKLKFQITICILFITSILQLHANKVVFDQDELKEPNKIKLQISMIPGVYPDDEIRFKFNLPMVKENQLNTKNFPTIKFKPDLKGTFKWKDQSELTFSPEKGSLEPGEYISVSITDAVPLIGKEYKLEKTWIDSFRVQYFQMAGKVANWKIEKGVPKFVEILNWHTNQVGKGPILLLYDQPVNLAQFKNRIKIFNKKNEENFIIELYIPEKIENDYNSVIDPQYVIALKIKNLPEDGEKINLKIPYWESLSSVKYTERLLEVRKSFNFTHNFQNKTKKGNIALNSSVTINFSNIFDLEYLKKYIKIYPEPKSYQIRGYGLQSINIQLELNSGVNYRLYSLKPIYDALGNELENKLDINFISQDMPPYLLKPIYPLTMEKQHAYIPIKTRNIKNIKVNVRKVSDQTEYIKAFKNDRDLKNAGEIVKTFDYSIKNFEMNSVIEDMISIEGIEGILIVDLESVGEGNESDGIINKSIPIQISNIAFTVKTMNNSLFCWLTDLMTPKPLDGVKLTAYSSNGKLLETKLSNSSGVAILENINESSVFGLSGFIFIVAEINNEKAIYYIKNDDLSEGWQFGIPQAVKGVTELKASIFSDRGVYRPEDKVLLKFMLKHDDINMSNKSIELIIKDPRGQILTDADLKLDNYLTTEYELLLKENAPVGKYLVQINSEISYKTFDFLVEEYRVPTFFVGVSSGSDNWENGKSIHAKINAIYAHGGLMPDREVKCKVYRNKEEFTSDLFNQYIFQYDTTPSYRSVVKQSEGLLDEKGDLNFDFDINHQSEYGLLKYTIEASVTDIDRQTYSNRYSKLVHPSDIYVGIKPPAESILNQGEKINLPVVVVDKNGNAISGIKVTIKVNQIEHHTTSRMSDRGDVQMTNREVSLDKFEQTIKSSNTPVISSFTLNKAGYYEITAEAFDKNNLKRLAGFKVTVSGDNTIAWPRFDKEQIEVVSDKGNYYAGETAKLVVQSPYKNAYCLLTIENDKIHDYKLYKITNNTPNIEFEIKEEYIPNVYASVVLLRGREHYNTDATNYETGAPGFKIGYKNIAVDNTPKSLNVSIGLKSNIAEPGETIHIKLDVSDYKLLKKEALATVMVVDESVLSLTNYKTPNPLNQVYNSVPLSIKTGTSILDMIHSRRSRRESVFPSGGGDSADAMVNAMLDIRSLFKSTAYWNPSVKIDENGQASIDIKLPDNITTYRIMAIAVDKSGKMGAGEQKIISKKQLMIQPVIPRFVYPDDRFSIEAIVFNNTEQDQKVNLETILEGFDLLEKTSSKSQTIKTGESEKFSFTVKSIRAKKAKILFKASAGKFYDNAEFELPILNPGTKQIIVKSDTITKSGSLNFHIPNNYIKNTMELEIVASTSALTELKDAVQYLMQYPNGCIEQTTSTAYPLIVLKNLLPEIGIEVNMADLKKFSEAGIKRILSFQTKNGGLSYWPGSNEPHAFATAFGLTALIEAKKQGYDIPDESLSKMADYLEESLRKGNITESIPHGNIADADTRALFVMTLGRLNRPQPAYISTLWKNNDKLSAFGLSFLAVAVKESASNQALLNNILKEIKIRAEVESREAYFSGKPKGGWSFDSPLRTHASALLAYSDGSYDPELSGKFLTGLLNRKSNGLWGNTQENVFGIMGVYQSVLNQKVGEEPEINISINNNSIDTKKMERPSKRVLRQKFNETEILNFTSGNKNLDCMMNNSFFKPVIFTSRLTYEEEISDDNKRSQNNGFEISRIYENLSGKTYTNTIPLGEIVKVRVIVKTKHQLNYCAIDDKLPAGLEPLNTKLSTTETIEQGVLSAIVQKTKSVLSYQEIRDHRVAFYVDEMLPGEYEFVYYARATTPGTYIRPAGRAEAMYQPDIFGQTSVDYIDVK